MEIQPSSGPAFRRNLGAISADFQIFLCKVFWSRTLTDEILCTITCEIEANMNSRPLTNVPSDVIDHLPLTPNHFLLSRSSVNLPPGVFIGDEKKTFQKLGVHCNK